MAITVLPEQEEADREAKERTLKRVRCRERGGKWDEATQTCVMPEPTTVTEKEGVPRVQTPEELEAGKLEVERIRAARGGIGAAEALAIKEEAQAKQAEKQAILAQPTERVELGAPELGATTVPFVGGIARSFALQGFDLATDKDDTSLDPIRKNLGIMTIEEINALNISEIQKKELEKGLSASENVGSLIEGIPGAKWLNKWLDIETPRGNLEEVMQDIKAMKRPILKYGADVRSGYMDKTTATLKINTAEQYIIAQEARLRLLILNSPSLEFNSDRVNGFETDIIIVKEAIQQARIDTVEGKILDPTELDIFEKAQFQNTDEWVTSDW